MTTIPNVTTVRSDEWLAPKPARREFAQAARAYVSAMDAFTRAIQVVQSAEGDDFEAATMYRNANAARARAFRDLVALAVELDTEHKAAQASTNPTLNA